MSSNWRNDVVALAALYLVLERGHTLKSEGKLSNPIFVQMEKAGLIDDMGLEYAVTDVGRDAVKRAVAAQDVLRQMEIFSCVDVGRLLVAEECDDQGSLLNHVWDPRFAANNPQGFDMRLAVISWLGEIETKKLVSLETIVFLQKLGSGAFSAEHFWSDVNAGLKECEAVVANAYKWRDVSSGDNPAACVVVMRGIYAAGQIEQRKRDGEGCGGCGIPLVLYGAALSKCPCCPCRFSEPAPSSMTCPKCSAAIYEGDPRCAGCGATIDFSLPSGTVQDNVEETVTTETVWSSSYGYVSYGWLDPWNPIADAVALSYLCYDPFWS